MDKEIEGFNEIKQMFSKTMYRIYNGYCGGDDGMPKLGVFYDKALKKWVLEKPIERSNNTSKRYFDSFEEIKESISFLCK